MKFLRLLLILIFAGSGYLTWHFGNKTLVVRDESVSAGTRSTRMVLSSKVSTGYDGAAFGFGTLCAVSLGLFAWTFVSENRKG
jgi:hypothetical protein